MITLNWSDKKRDLLRVAEVLVRDEISCHGNADTDGDNPLKTLASRYARAVKCIYMAPPFNTGADFEHYQDNFRHTTCLTNIYQRLQAMCTMLSDKGSIWVSIYNCKLSNLKITMDEIFGRKNFLSKTIIYASGCHFEWTRMDVENIEFRHIPYDCKK